MDVQAVIPTEAWMLPRPRPDAYVGSFPLHFEQPPRPSGTRLVRRIVILTRTWHAPRLCFVFEKMAVNGKSVEPTVLFE